MPAFDAAVTLAGGAVGSLTQAHTVGGATNMILLVGTDVEGGTNTSTSVTYNSVGLTLLTRVIDATSRVAELWYLVGPPAGTFDVVTTFSAVSDAAMRIISYSDVNQGTPFGPIATGNVNDASPTTTVVSAGGELVVDHVASAVLLSATAGGGQVERGKLLDAGGASVFGSEKIGAASVIMSWTLDAARHWCAIGVSLKPGFVGAPSLIGSFIPPLVWATRIRS